MDTNICLYCEKSLATPNASFCSRTCYAREAASKQAPVWVTPPGLSSTRIQRSAIFRAESFPAFGICRGSPLIAKTKHTSNDNRRSMNCPRLMRSLSSPGSSSILTVSYASSGRVTPEDEEDEAGSCMATSLSLSHPESTFLRQKEQQEQHQEQLKQQIRPS
ncbi:hypothetical protein BCR43DRAFT_506963 [Syncephalastrum racemosum]|uniref:Uncharacterized protein n=1 Tax=Syncephalastrum racemosum TaxID=13706 RepID=A0A1X2H917_SYNRA|nr:hypothetical protein BCR43DRAFT_506963 [Syncephalastrum racemosum]